MPSWSQIANNSKSQLSTDRWDKKLNVFKFSEHSEEYIGVRLIGDPFPVLEHTVPVKVEDAIRIKNKEASFFKNKDIKRYSFICPDFDPILGESRAKSCPFCCDFSEYVSNRVITYCQGFVRLPDDENPDGDNWSEDLYVFKFSPGVMYKLYHVMDRIGQKRHLRDNSGKPMKADPSDIDTGFSVDIIFNKRALQQNDYWNCDFSNNMPLDKHQKEIVASQKIDFSSIFVAGNASEEKKALINRKWYSVILGIGNVSENTKSSTAATTTMQSLLKKKRDVENDTDDDDNLDEEIKPRVTNKNNNNSSNFGDEKSHNYEDDFNDNEGENDLDDDDDEPIIPTHKSRNSVEEEPSISKPSRPTAPIDDDDDEPVIPKHLHNRSSYSPSSESVPEKVVKKNRPKYSMSDDADDD